MQRMERATSQLPLILGQAQVTPACPEWSHRPGWQAAALWHAGGSQVPGGGMDMTCPAHLLMDADTPVASGPQQHEQAVRT